MKRPTRTTDESVLLAQMPCVYKQEREREHTKVVIMQGTRKPQKHTIMIFVKESRQSLEFDTLQMREYAFQGKTEATQKKTRDSHQSFIYPPAAIARFEDPKSKQTP